MIIWNRNKIKFIFGTLLVVAVIHGTGCSLSNSVGEKEETVAVPLAADDSVLAEFQEEIEAALLPHEFIVDYIQEEVIVYTLVNSEEAAEYGDRFLVLTEENGKWIRTYENDFGELKPWKIETADIDGDKVKEILIAVKKTTHYDKEEKNRMFIFNYEDGVLVKKWTGSQIAGVWRDFYAGDVVSAPGTELILLEQLEDGKEKIKIYSWFDFGFFLLAESDGYAPVRGLMVPEENILQITQDEGQQIRLIMKDGKLVVAEE